MQIFRGQHSSQSLAFVSLIGTLPLTIKPATRTGPVDPDFLSLSVLLSDHKVPSSLERQHDRTESLQDLVVLVCL